MVRFSCVSMAPKASLMIAGSWTIPLITSYLPEQLSESELEALIAESISAAGAQSIKDMGKVMGLVKQKAQGRADMGAVGAKIKAKLGG